MNLAIQLTPDQETSLLETARRLNVSVEDLAAAILRDFVSQPSEAFEKAADRVFEKNAELYRRLA